MTEPFEDFYTDEDWEEALAANSYSQPVGVYITEVVDLPKWVISRNGLPELRVKAKIAKTLRGEPGENKTLNPKFPLLPDAWAKANLQRFAAIVGVGSYTGLLPQVVNGERPTTIRALLETHGEQTVDDFPLPLSMQVTVSSKIKKYIDEQTGEEKSATNYYYNLARA